MLRRICPEGIDRCHCLNKPGTLTKGPFYFNEDPIQASITHVTCTPGIQHLVMILINCNFKIDYSPNRFLLLQRHTHNWEEHDATRFFCYLWSMSEGSDEPVPLSWQHCGPFSIWSNHHLLCMPTEKGKEKEVMHNVYAMFEQLIYFSVNVREIRLQKNILQWAVPTVVFHGAHTLANVSQTLCAMMALLSSWMISSCTWMHGALTAFAQMALPRDAEQTGGSWLAQMGVTLIPQPTLGKAMLTIATQPAFRPTKDIGNK